MTESREFPLGIKIAEPQSPSSLSFSVGPPRGVVFTIRPDGRLERGPGFASDNEASVALFDVLSTVFPSWISGLRQRAEKAEAEVADLRQQIECMDHEF